MSERAPSTPTSASPVDASSSKDSSRWPSPLRQFLWDMLPAKTADRWLPRASGIRAPAYERPSWLQEEFTNTPAALEQAKRGHDAAVARAEVAEAKADRLVQRSLTLLTLTLVVAGAELRYVREQGGGLEYLLLIPAVLAIMTLALAGIEAAEIDRVGAYHQPGAEALAAWKDAPVRGQVEAEELGRQWAHWTASHKYDALLQTRAWFSRGLVWFLVAAMVLAFTLSGGEKKDGDTGRVQGPTTNSTAKPGTTTTRPTQATSPPAPTSTAR
jgi:hypothetical protein